jgi:hypothetical protein
MVSQFLMPNISIIFLSRNAPFEDMFKWRSLVVGAFY